MSDQRYDISDSADGDEPLSNHSDNPHFSEILERNLSRRKIVKAGLGTAVTTMFGATALPMLAQANPTNGGAAPAFVPPNAAQPPVLAPTLGFEALPLPAVRTDTALLPEGYKAQALIPWGAPLNGSSPAYRPDGRNTGAEQEAQIGSHHDGMHYFPFDEDPNGHGLLCVNHEYVDQAVLHPEGPTTVAGKRPTDEVRKEIAAHGVSVVEVRRDGNGVWDIVSGAFNRRITAGTTMDLRGPVRGSDLVRTKFSPSGTQTRGTINNCAHGYTPWGTYLTCEENWAGYFKNDVQSSRIEALFAALGFAGTTTRQGDYIARYDAARNAIIGVIDETVDQKITTNVYTQAGNTLTSADRALLGEFGALLAANGIDLQIPREHSRYGVPTRSRYGWETAESGADEYIRFDASIKGGQTEDYHNEPNTMGWVVEIDPFDPSSVPQKRTTLGRFAHEGAWLCPPQEGQPVVWYMGDDAQNEYIYKFVSRARYQGRVVERAKQDPALRRRLGELFMDHGTLYVARFNEDGSGEWLALDIGNPAFVAAAAAAGVEFAGQADVLVNTRLAADVVGATKMDRPEWGTVHPQTREVYMTLTNNSSRAADEVDAANPRPANATGHIIRWREQGNRAWAQRFEWDLFVLAGSETASQVLPGENGPALTADNKFASPDGIWIDQFGTLWIQTDMSGSQQAGTSAAGDFGANQMLAANPRTGEIKRFLIGPNDQETTGVVSTPDGRTLFVNFQHPGDRTRVIRSNGTYVRTDFTSNWPEVVYRNPGDATVVANPAGARPRSGTLVITREDGGIVGR